jgi:hypothetical protein
MNSEKKFALYVTYQAEDWEITVLIARFCGKEEAEIFQQNSKFKIFIEGEQFLRKTEETISTITDSDILQAAKVKEDSTNKIMLYPEDFEVHSNFTVAQVLKNPMFRNGFGSLAYQILEVGKTDSIEQKYLTV